MLLLIIFWSIISFLLIFTVHYLLNFFTDTLTVPKVKDLINQPKTMYSEIETTLKCNNLEKVSDNANNANNANNNSNNTNLSNQELNAEDMKSELKNFFNDLKNEKLGTTTSTWDTVYSQNNLSFNK